MRGELNEFLVTYTLSVARIEDDAAPVAKRFHARAKGRGNRIVKPTCHVFLTVGDGKKD